MELGLTIVTIEDDLPLLVDQINSAAWDDENAVDDHYSCASLRSYLGQQDTIFVVCHLTDETGYTLAGMASARLQYKPYGELKWLYIDEVDTCTNLRQRGVGTALMRKLLDIADNLDCDEVWLGADVKNSVANIFYESLQPDATDHVIGYTFDL